MPEQAEPRLWAATEVDSSDLLSLPLLVESFRRNLSKFRPAPVSWDDIIETGRKIGFPVETVAPDSADLTLQIWLLAAAWIRYVYPGHPAGDCLGFGRAVAALAYRTPCLPEMADPRFANACAEVRQELSDPFMRKVTPSGRMFLAVEILRHIYDSLK